MTIQIRLPEKIIFGSGSFSRLGELSVGLGKRALICTGKSSLQKSGRLKQAVELLRERDIRAEVFGEVENDPNLHTCDHAINFARERRCDFVIAIGGGSALDVGKTAAAVAPQPAQLGEYFAGNRKIENAPLPFLAAPTTAGTGSECTNNAVLTDSEKGIKKSLRDDRMVPNVALVDPELTLTCPPDITAQCGMDALTQAVECYVTLSANPITDSLALRAIELIATHLPPAVADGKDPACREAVAMGSLLAAMAFGNAGLGAVHGLAHPLGAQFHIPHGLVCAVLLPHVCTFNMPVRKEKFQEIASLVAAKDAEEVPAALAALNRRAGIPDSLKEFGIKETDILAILADCRSGSMAKNPRPASDEELAEILQKVI